ncbi:MAG: hypothetical protein QOF48_765 [Verrucomicrobiota bacterium]|jgi:hypothetical protein
MTAIGIPSFLALPIAFGLWCVLFPHSVIRFYTWFHRGRVKMPEPFGVRLAGEIWVSFIMIIVALTALHIL